MNLQILKAPYPGATSKQLFKSAFLISIFVFGFLFFFAPFGLSNSLIPLWKISLGYGLISFAVVSASALLVKVLKLNEKFESRWTFGLELLANALNLFLIGIGNAIFSAYIFEFNLTLSIFFTFQIFTLGVGIFPVFFSLYFRFNKLERQFKVEANLINTSSKSERQETSDRLKIIEIHSELKSENFKLKLGDFIAAETLDNYINIYYLENNDLQKKTIRSTLLNLQRNFENYPNILRPHRSYLVNTFYIKNFTGNAAGLKLNIKHLPFTIPVSRANVESIKELIK
jgi:hypothetical protein